MQEVPELSVSIEVEVEVEVEEMGWE